MAKILINISEKGFHPIKINTVIKDLSIEEQDITRLRAMITKAGIELVMKGFLILHLDQGGSIDKLTKTPKASPLAQFQASQEGCDRVTNCLGDRVEVDAVCVFLLRHLNGKNDINDLIKKLINEVKCGRLVLKTDLKKSDKDIEKSIREATNKALHHFADKLLLIE